MNRVQTRIKSTETELLQQGAEKPPSRRDKTNAILGEVLPLALSLGLNAVAGNTEDKAARGTFALGGSTKGRGGAGLISNTTRSAGTTAATLGGAEILNGSAGAGAGAGAISSWASMAGGIVGALDIALNWGRSTPARGATSGTAVGAMVGTMICPGVGTAIGAAIGALGGGLLGSIKTGKHHDQKLRDQVRELLVGRGVLDSDYSIGLSDGSRFNIGYDGGPKGELGGRRPFETDMSNPLTKYAISWLNPVIAFLSQGNEKVQSDFVGYFANAAISNARSILDLKANVNAIIKQFGLDDKTIVKGVVQAAEGGAIDTEIAKAWLNGVRERNDDNLNVISEGVE